ncbi:MAG TPA: hypothetical protein VFB26_00890 [Gaiellaceae bacterium]|nr:hypothetical protein [Gaiellaceae bacterium]
MLADLRAAERAREDSARQRAAAARLSERLRVVSAFAREMIPGGGAPPR